MVFCTECGTQAPGGKFCFQCGSRLPGSVSSHGAIRQGTTPMPPAYEGATSSLSSTFAASPGSNAAPRSFPDATPGSNFVPASAPVPAAAGNNAGYSNADYGSPPPPPSHTSPPPPPPSQNTVLIDAYGQRTTAFNQLAASLFIALDQSVEPKGSRGLEPSKMVQWRTIGRKSIPEYYESHVLPFYCESLSSLCYGDWTTTTDLARQTLSLMLKPSISAPANHETSSPGTDGIDSSNRRSNQTPMTPTTTSSARSPSWLLGYRRH